MAFGEESGYLPDSLQPFFGRKGMPDLIHGMKKKPGVPAFKYRWFYPLFHFVGIFNELLQGHGHGGGLRSRCLNI